MSVSTKSATESKVSESDFLRQEAENAKLRMGAALNQAKEAMVGKVDPHKLTRKHPILSILTAVIGGFVAALLAIPSREEQELRRLERLHRATHPAPPPSQTSNGKSENPAPAEKRSIGAVIVHEIIGMIKPILLATITAGIKSATTPPPASAEVKPPENG